MTKRPHPAQVIHQSVAPIRPGLDGDSDIYNRIDNSLVVAYLATDSYVAKASGMTNSKALQVKTLIAGDHKAHWARQVLAEIERKLAGYIGGSEAPLTVKKQVQEMIEEATDLRNLAQGELGRSFPSFRH